MNPHSIVADVLLAVAVVIVLAGCVGLSAMRDTYQRIHFLSPVSLVAPVFVALAVTVQSGWHQATGATWLALGFVAVSSPFLSHATARAARISKEGDWRQPRDRRAERGS